MTLLNQGCIELSNSILKLTEYRIHPCRNISIAVLIQLVYRLFDIHNRIISALEDNYIKHSNVEIECIEHLRLSGVNIPQEQYKIKIGDSTYFIYEFNPEDTIVIIDIFRTPII